MQAQLKKGDVVKLKSGGPEMTVLQVSQKQDSVKVLCQWFDDNQQLQKNEFDEEILETSSDINDCLRGIIG